MYTRAFVGTNPTDEPVSAAHRALCSLSRYDSACRFAAANSLRRSMGGQTNRAVQYHHTRSNSVPKNSIQRRAIPQFWDQFRGDICGLPAPCNAPFTQGVDTMRFHSLRALVLFSLVALALLANAKKPVVAAQLAPP